MCYLSGLDHRKGLSKRAGGYGKKSPKKLQEVLRSEWDLQRTLVAKAWWLVTVIIQNIGLYWFVSADNRYWSIWTCIGHNRDDILARINFETDRKNITPYWPRLLFWPIFSKYRLIDSKTKNFSFITHCNYWLFLKKGFLCENSSISFVWGGK